MRAFVALTFTTLRRFAREPRVVRSVMWPIFLVPVTLALTLLVLTAARTPLRVVAVLDSEAAIQSHLTSDGWTVLSVSDPHGAVQRGDAPVGTDGLTLWATGSSDRVAELDAAIRTVRRSAWRFESRRIPADPEAMREIAATAFQPLAMLYMLYALVFSLGSLARDADEQILDAELSLPIGAWVPAAARWSAAVITLGISHGLAIGMLQTILPANDPVAYLLRGTGAIAAAAAIGVAVAPGPGSRSGFSQPFALASIVLAAAFVAGPLVPGGAYLPVASVRAGGAGASSLFLGLLAGPVAAQIFALRTRRAA